MHYLKFNKLPKLILLVLGLVILFEIASLILYHDSKITEGSFDPQKELVSLRSQKGTVYDNLLKNIGTILQKKSINSAIKLTETALSDGDVSFDQCHNLLHIIGHEAYQFLPGKFAELSTYSSSMCIDSFEHGVEAQIVYDSKNPTADLEKYCSALRERYPGIICYHGAGHAYMQILRDPNKSLVRCDLLEGGPATELWNCYRGVFSEYGNEVLGYDTDTGEPLLGGPRFSLDKNSPLLFCNQFSEKYRESCYSQITKVLISGGLVSSLNRCLNPAYESKASEVCVDIIANDINRSTLSINENYTVPDMVQSWPENLKHSYILGVKEAFDGLRQSNINRNWNQFCQLFNNEADKQFCLASYS